MNVRLSLADWSSKTNRERARGGFLHQGDWKTMYERGKWEFLFACSPLFFRWSLSEKMCLRHLLLCLLGVIVIVNGESFIYPFVVRVFASSSSSSKSSEQKWKCSIRNRVVWLQVQWKKIIEWNFSKSDFKEIGVSTKLSYINIISYTQFYYPRSIPSRTRYCIPW